MVRLVQVMVPHKEGERVVLYLEDIGRVTNVMSICADNGRLVLFHVMSTEHLKFILFGLEALGVGVNFGTVTIIPTQANLPHGVYDKHSNFSLRDGSPTAEVYEKIQSGAVLTFDYLALIVMSSSCAAVGLATDDKMPIVASMLLSPLMDPILLTAIGACLGEWRLCFRGLRNEMVGLMLSVFVGMVFGASLSPMADQLGWPCDEMRLRGGFGGLPYSAMVAVLVGVGSAIAATRNDVSSMVGVSIAASLNTPAVNSGLMLAYGGVAPYVSGRPVDESLLMEIASGSFAMLLCNVALILIFAFIVFKLKKLKPFLMVNENEWQMLPKIDRRVKHFQETRHKIRARFAQSPPPDDGKGTAGSGEDGSGTQMRVLSLPRPKIGSQDRRGSTSLLDSSDI